MNAVSHTIPTWEVIFVDCDGRATGRSPWLVARGCGVGGKRDVYRNEADAACSASTLK